MKIKYRKFLAISLLSLVIFADRASGQAWAALGTGTSITGNGVDNVVYAMAANNASHILYVGGQFAHVYNSNAGTVAAAGIAQWTAQFPSSSPYTQGTWAALPGGGGVSGSSATVYAVAFDATNQILYLGGDFTNAGGVAVNSLAQYNVSTHVWASVGSGVSGGTGFGFSLYAEDNNNGGGPYNGGGYPVMALALDASGNLYVGGNFSTVGGAVTASNIAEFVPAGSHNGTGTWYHLGASNAAQGVSGTQWDPPTGNTFKADATVYAINIDGSNNVWVGGQFTTARGGLTVNNIAEWIPTGAGTGTWYAMTSGGGTGITGYYDGGVSNGLEGPYLMYSECPAVLALASSGSTIYAGGQFSKAGGTNVYYNLSQWTVSGAGTGSWSYVGADATHQGVQNGALDGGEITALLVYNNNLYIGGEFEDGDGKAQPSASTYEFNAICYWNGSFNQMPASAPGFEPDLWWNYALCALSGVGNGNYGILYAGGYDASYFASSQCYTNAGVEANNIAQWAGNSTILPIKLLSFDAQYNTEEHSVDLSWVTATETNNKFFTIERSNDGVNWEQLVDVAGAGNSSQAINYTAEDKKPYPGVSYYRLKQTDYDGNYTYSEIKAVDINAPLNQLSIVPNPVGKMASVTFNFAEASDAVLNIFDCTGRLISTVPINAMKGENTTLLNVSGYASGVYIITVSNSTEQYTSRFVVSH